MYVVLDALRAEPARHTEGSTLIAAFADTSAKEHGLRAATSSILSEVSQSRENVLCFFCQTVCLIMHQRYLTRNFENSQVSMRFFAEGEQQLLRLSLHALFYNFSCLLHFSKHIIMLQFFTMIVFRSRRLRFNALMTGSDGESKKYVVVVGLTGR